MVKKYKTPDKSPQEYFESLFETQITAEALPLYITALTHRSFPNEQPNADSLEHNERLEFLGDAILEHVVTAALFFKYPQEKEGSLTSYRSALVKKETLAKVALDIGLPPYMRLSRGEEKTGGREKDYLLANTFEAILGALYIDK